MKILLSTLAFILAFAIPTFATFDSTQLYYNSSNGYFGLGTDTPQSYLNLKSTNPILTLQSTAAGSTSGTGYAGLLFRAPLTDNGSPSNRWLWQYSAKDKMLYLYDY